MSRRRVVHFTSVHSPGDNRIRLKECASLRAAGWEVLLIAPMLEGGVAPDGIRLLPVPVPKGRLGRMLITGWHVFNAVRSAPADVYHFHDPELLPWAWCLAVGGRTVVYDMHEDVAGTVAYKGYLPRALRPAIAWGVGLVERWCAKRLAAVVVATPHLATRAARIGPPVVVVQNFPRLEELSLGAAGQAYEHRDPVAVYVGVIAAARGAMEMIDALPLASGSPGLRLHLAGRWSPETLREAAARRVGWSQVVDHGHMDRPAVVELLGRSRVGVVTIWPERNYVESYATKMFEYMAMGLPVVGSDFPLWRSILGDGPCGLLVDPKDPTAIAGAIDWLLSHPDEAKAMGERGRVAVEARYQWDGEASRLLALYDDLCGPPGLR